ncbi:MAG: DUF4127 family protein [Oscillibacter sp.]|nr:DUF4127 family protein [Oscillibacter sp.]
MRKKRILAAVLAGLLLTGCGPHRTDPADAEVWDVPPDAEKVIAYVPLDDRPDNEERVIYLAESLGYTLAMPERDLYHTALDGQPLNANGTQSGDRAALYEWVLEQEKAGCDRYILFMDQLLSGGLVNSRHMTEYQPVTLSDGRMLTERELLEELLLTLAADGNNRVWLLDSVMRLAPTVGYAGFGLEEYNALREYGMQARPELAESELGLERVLELYGKTAGGESFVSSDFALEAEQVVIYLNARTRKLELADYMLWLLEQLGNEFYPGLSRDNFRVLIGVDDSSEEDSIQKNEIAFLRMQLREGDALLSGVDDLAFKAVAKLYLEELGWDGANVCVRYFGGTEELPACAYDYKPLTEIVEEHFDFFGLRETTAAESDLMLLVLTQPADEAKKAAYYEQLIEELKDHQENTQRPVMLIDAGNARYGTAFHEALTEEVELGWLLSYAGALDMAIVTGTALSHGVARYARLSLDYQHKTQVSERAFLRTVADSVLKDFCYRHVVRAEITAYARDTLGGVADNFWNPEIDRTALLELLERRMTEQTAEVIRNLERSNFINELPEGKGEYSERGWGGIALENYRYPWDRAFEMSMDIQLGEWTEPHKKVLGVYYK